MKRILISQSELNDGSDYIVVNGELIDDEINNHHYSKEFSNFLNWKKIVGDDQIEIRKSGDKLLLKSFYNENDTVGRSIYYMYLIDKDSNFENLVNFLEADSKVIKRTIDRMAVDKMVESLKKMENLKKVLNGLFFLVIVLGISYLIFKNINIDYKFQK